MKREKEFIEWLIEKPKKVGEGKYAVNSIRLCKHFLGTAMKKLEITGKNGERSIFDIEDYETFIEVAEKIFSHRDYKELDGPKSGNRWIREGLKLYAEFLEDMEDNDSLESVAINTSLEGRKTMYFTTRYERNDKNRKAALEKHGYKCECCGFDFAKEYGTLGEKFIEVHHVVPLFSRDEEVVPDPETDFVSLCSNCHRMIHRKKDMVLKVEELKQIIESAKENRD